MRQPESSVHVIAEAGTNHGGSFERAVQLVEIAKAAGADSVKFQIIYPEGLYLPVTHDGGTMRDNEVYRKRQAAMLSDEEYVRLAAHCRACDLPFSASVFDERGVRLLDALDVPYIKLASCDLNHDRLIRCAAATGRKIILSTGMSEFDEITHAVEAVDTCGAGDRLVLMHCVSVYPCPTAEIALHQMDRLRTAFGRPVGFSDHTERSVAAALAVAAGASVIEKHFTHDRSAEGFDHAYAMEPDAMRAFIEDVRAAWALTKLGDGSRHPREIELRTRARRGVYAARDMRPGEVITEADVLIVRPAGPLRPNDVERLIGCAVHHAVRRYDPITTQTLGPA